MDKKITERKRFAEINGEKYSVGYPECSGCPHLCIPYECFYGGNGCKYPDERKKHPKTMEAV